MAFDVDRYNRLRESAVANFELWRGTYADLSRNRLAMTAVGTPTWGQINGLPCLDQSADADGVTSGNVDAIVDVTDAFSVEWCGVPRLAGVGSDTLLSQVDANGGFCLDWDCTNAVFVLTLYNNVGALARSITTPATSAVVGKATALVITSATGGTVGAAMLNGVPVAATLGGAGAAANIGAAAPVVACGGGVGRVSSLLVRAHGSAVGRQDQAALHGAARALTGGEV